MTHRTVLVVDDEKNIRRTLAAALQDMDLHVETAAGGEEALITLEKEEVDLVLLDLRMPGMDGLDVLRRLRHTHPEMQVIIITAHGTVERAVEAMRLGAVDFIQKPFSVDALRSSVEGMWKRKQLDLSDEASYEASLERARHAITHQQFEKAQSHLQQAFRLDDTRPEAYNLLGVLYEIDGDRFQAQQHFRKALELDPSYEAARINLYHSVEPDARGSFMLEEVKRTDVESPDA